MLKTEVETLIDPKTRRINDVIKSREANGYEVIGIVENVLEDNRHRINRLVMRIVFQKREDELIARFEEI